MSFKQYLLRLVAASLNPCCNGIYSMRVVWKCTKDYTPVLILVVMEYTQWAMLAAGLAALAGLNPCCNGIYSMRNFN